jgi:hypothetical protein
MTWLYFVFVQSVFVFVGRTLTMGGGGDDAADVFRNLFNLLPLMLVFLMYFLAPGTEVGAAVYKPSAVHPPVARNRLVSTLQT